MGHANVRAVDQYAWNVRLQGTGLTTPPPLLSASRKFFSCSWFARCGWPAGV
jgi:hypothetical protein